MYGMFSSASSFNQDLSDWDMSAVERAGHMFYRASSFDQNLGGWNLTNLERMSFMFSESGMSTSNYDATLAGWVAFNQSGEKLQPDVQLCADGHNWCENEAARMHQIEKAGVTII